MLFSSGTLAEMAVTDDDFHKLLATRSALSPPQLTALDAAIRGRLGVAIEPPSAAVEAACELRTDCASIADIEARFGAKPLCPRCQSAKVTKWGSANRLKRYRCKTCKATFNASNRNAAGAIAQTRIMDWTRPDAGRWDFAAQSGGAPRCASELRPSAGGIAS